MNTHYSLTSSDSSSRSGGVREHDQRSPNLAASPVFAHLLPQSHRRITLPDLAVRDEPWWRRFLPGYSRPIHQNPSGMYTIISMSDCDIFLVQNPLRSSSENADERLQPRRTWLWLSFSGLLVAMLIACVFVVVPRGVTVGSITFVPHNWHKKSDHGTYTLQLGVHIPVYNANYFPAQVYGTMKVLFLDVQAGSDELPGLPVEARSQATGQELHFCMDASGVPVEYGLTIIQICMLYPRKLMFICKADLTVKTWVAKYELPTIDTYFMVNCYDQDALTANQPPLDPICSEMPPAEDSEVQEWQTIQVVTS